MACACHGVAGVVKEGRMKPTEQCTMCAYKHLEMALSAYSELSYEIDNREYVAGQLRLAVEHLKLDNREIALRVRDLAVTLETAKDSNKQQFSECIGNALKVVRELMYKDHPEILNRLKVIPQAHGRFVPDIIIPIGTGSQIDNEELRMLLRSIETNLKDYGRIYIVTHTPPAWLNQNEVTVVDVPDKYAQNKDANLHLKTLTTIEKYGIDKFIWCADDNLFMQPVTACELPTLYNRKNRQEFYKAGSKWQKRVCNTFEWADKRGVHLDFQYEVHAPQLFDGRKLLKGMKDVDYVSLPGLTIYTAWRVVTDTWQNALPQSEWKLTLEQEDIPSIERRKDEDYQSRLFLGYNDTAVKGGLIARLRAIFPNRSKYEL